MVNVGGREYVIEVKANVWIEEYERGRRQLVEYVRRRGMGEGWYVIYSGEIEASRYERVEEGGVVVHEWRVKTRDDRPSGVRAKKRSSSQET